MTLCDLGVKPGVMSMVVKRAVYEVTIQTPTCVPHPRKHKTSVEHLYNVGPTSSTLGQYCANVIQMLYKCFVFAGIQPASPPPPLPPPPRTGLNQCSNHTPRD